MSGAGPLRMPRAWVSPHPPETWFSDRDGRVWAKCAQGHLARLGDHRIHPDGRVEPMVLCPSCSWARMVVLSDWAEPSVGGGAA